MRQSEPDYSFVEEKKYIGHGIDLGNNYSSGIQWILNYQLIIKASVLLRGGIKMLMFYMALLGTDEERLKISDIYEKHKNRLVAVALAMTHNQSMAEDAVHNTFLSIIKHKEKIFSMDETDFFKWSVIVVKAKCIDLFRREQPFAESPYDSWDENLPAHDSPIDVEVAQKDMYERLIRHIAKLDDINRQILEMKYLLQMSFQEIGDELGFTPIQVNSRIARARAKIRKQMETEFSDYE